MSVLSVFAYDHSNLKNYTYDENGNLKTDGKSYYTYDNLDRLTSIETAGSTITYKYDGKGNLIADGKSNYAYDNLGRLISIQTVGNSLNSNGLLLIQAVQLKFLKLEHIGSNYLNKYNALLAS